MTRVIDVIRRVRASGTGPDTPLAIVRQVRICNAIAMVVGALAVVSVPVDLQFGPRWIVVEDLMLALCCTGVVVLNRRRNFAWARVALYCTCYAFAVGNALVLGKESGQHLLLLPLGILPLVIFSEKKGWTIVIYMMIATITLIVLEMWGFSYAAAHFPTPSLSRYYYMYSTIVTMFVLIVCVRDFVVAHVRTEDELRARDDRYRLITETARDGIVTIDVDGRIEFASPACEVVFGWPVGSLLGQPLARLLPSALVEDAATAQETEAKHASGSLIPVEVSVGVSTLAPGLRTLIIRDVTDRVRSQRQIDAARAGASNSARLAALGELASGVAHEINNPLAALGLAADHLRRNAAQAEDVVYTANRIQRITGRIDKIVSALSFFGRDGTRDAMVRTSVQQLFDDTLELCGERFRRHNVVLRVSCEPTELDVDCRGVELSQVLLNLLFNAHDAVAGNPAAWVELTASIDGDAVVLAVVDSNPGIAPELHDRIFEPFFTTKQVGKGTGLGLSVSHGIVQAHHGEIALDVEAPNTRFVVRIPRRIGPHAPLTQTTAEASQDETRVTS